MDNNEADEFECKAELVEKQNEQSLKELKEFFEKNITALSVEMQEIKSLCRKSEEETLEDKYDLSKADLILRAKEYGRENLKILYGFIKVIGLTTATVVLLNILFFYHLSPFSLTNIIHLNFHSVAIWWHEPKNVIFSIRLVMWVTTCMVLILTYDAGMFGSMFLPRMIDEFHLLLIFSYIGFEFFLFAILYPNFFVEKLGTFDTMDFKEAIEKFDFATAWLFVYGLYTISIGLLAMSALRRIDVDHIEELYPLNSDCRITLKERLKMHYRSDITETFIGGAISIILVIKTKYSYHSDISTTIDHKLVFQLVNAGISMFAIFYFYKRQYFRRKKITDYYIIFNEFTPLRLKTILYILRYYEIRSFLIKLFPVKEKQKVKA
jgi:hypothetical protein